jgi:hypothetical protein
VQPSPLGKSRRAPNSFLTLRAASFSTAAAKHGSSPTSKPRSSPHSQASLGGNIFKMPNYRVGKQIVPLSPRASHSLAGLPSNHLLPRPPPKQERRKEEKKRKASDFCKSNQKYVDAHHQRSPPTTVPVARTPFTSRKGSRSRKASCDSEPGSRFRSTALGGGSTGKHSPSSGQTTACPRC